MGGCHKAGLLWARSPERGLHALFVHRPHAHAHTRQQPLAHTPWNDHSRSPAGPYASLLHCCGPLRKQKARTHENTARATQRPQACALSMKWCAKQACPSELNPTARPNHKARPNLQDFTTGGAGPRHADGCSGVSLTLNPKPNQVHLVCSIAVRYCHGPYTHAQHSMKSSGGSPTSYQAASCHILRARLGAQPPGAGVPRPSPPLAKQVFDRHTRCAGMCDHGFSGPLGVPHHPAS